MLSYEARRVKFLVKMLKTERPRIICRNNVKIAIDSFHERRRGTGDLLCGIPLILHLA